MVSYVQDTLWKDLIIVIFVESFKTTTSEKLPDIFYWYFEQNP